MRKSIKDWLFCRYPHPCSCVARIWSQDATKQPRNSSQHRIKDYGVGLLAGLVEPGRNRIWPLDKDKVRQMLYHLIFSVIQLSATGSVVRIHVSHKENTLNITIWVSHPWLGDGITEVDPYFRLNSSPLLELAGETKTYDHPENQEATLNLPVAIDQLHNGRISVSSILEMTQQHGNLSRERLGLLLSCELAELHGGYISIQGSSESGYRYVLSLPLNQQKAQAMSDVSSNTSS